MRKEETIKELLQEIIDKRGAYSIDVLTHAENCINNASELALEIMKRLSLTELMKKGKEEK